MLATRERQATQSVVCSVANAAKLGSLPARHLAVMLSAYAALLHNWVLPEHYREWWGYGLYFLVAAAAQGFGAGLLLFWPRRWVLLLGILGNSAILVLYAITRTVGIPVFGPAAGQVEPVGPLDLATAAAELGLVIVLVQLVRKRPRARPTARSPQTISHDRRELLCDAGTYPDATCSN